MSNRISQRDLPRIARHALNMWRKEIEQGVSDAAFEAAEKMVQRTRQRPTKHASSGKYARAMAAKRGAQKWGFKSAYWYVKKPRYRLTHLINNGHAIRGGGRYDGDKHVTKAAEQAMIDFENGIRRRIRDASN